MTSDGCCFTSINTNRKPSIHPFEIVAKRYHKHKNTDKFHHRLCIVHRWSISCKKKLRNIEEQNLKAAGVSNSNSLPRQQQPPTSKTSTLPNNSSAAQNTTATLTKSPSTTKIDSGYGRDIKDIPLSMWRLVSNPIYTVTCLGACMELMIVSGFIVFLPKYLETQFSVGKSQASVYTGEFKILRK